MYSDKRLKGSNSNISTITEKSLVKVLKNGQQTRWMAMLRVLPPTFKPVNNLICCKTVLMWDGKTRNIAIELVCSNVARQVARFLLPVFPYLYYSVLCNHQTFSIKVILYVCSKGTTRYQAHVWYGPKSVGYSLNE